MTASTAGVTQVITVKKPYTVKVPGHRDGLSGQAMSQAFGFRFASLVRPLRGRAGAVASPHREQVQVPLRHCARLRRSAQMFSSERHGGSHHSRECCLSSHSLRTATPISTSGTTPGRVRSDFAAFYFCVLP